MRMRSMLAALAATVVLWSGCAAEIISSNKGEEDNAAIGGKLDSWRNPTEHGQLHFGPPVSAAFEDDASFHAWDFTLTGPAEVVLELSGREQNMDTVMYLYRREPGADLWGSYIARDDDGGAGMYSRIAKTVDAGEFRVLVKGFKEAVRGPFSLTADCSGAGCPGGGAAEDPVLPATTSFTEGCLQRMVAATMSPVVSSDELEVTWAERVRLTGVDRKAVSYFGAVGLEDIDPSELEEATLTVQIVRMEDGTLVDVGTGSDWSFEFLFDGAGALITHHFIDQSPDSQWYCAAAGEAEINAPEEFCAGAFLSALPHDQDGEGEVNETYAPDQPNDEISPHGWAAIAAYRARAGIGESVEISMEGKTWEAHGWGQGSELSLTAAGKATVTYLVSDEYVLTETEGRTGRVLCGRVD